MKKTLSILLALALVLTLVGSAVAETTVTLLTYRMGEDVGAKFFIPQVERFNEKYAGTYKIVLEESPSNTHTERMKQLALQDKLPAMFQCSDSQWVESYLVANDKLQDLSSFIAERPEMASRFVADSVAFTTKENDKVVALPLTVLKPTGLYYNSAIFSPEKPLTEMTWDEFSAALGENKIAYQTAEGGWTLSLILTAIMGSLEGGADALRAGVNEKITNFNTDLFIEAFTILQNSFLKNGSNNAIGVPYPDAANSFYSNQTAVLPDGTWIIDKVNDNTDWTNGFDGTKVVGDYYPGNVAIANPCVYDWMMPANLPEEEQKLAYAFFEFICQPEEIEAYILAEGGSAPNLKYSEAFMNKLSEKKLLSDFASKLNENTTFVPYWSDAISHSLFLGDFTNFMPNLYTGEWTPQQFCEELTKVAQE